MIHDFASSVKREWCVVSDGLFKSPENKGSGMSLSVPSKCWSVTVDVLVNWPRLTVEHLQCALCVPRLRASVHHHTYKKEKRFYHFHSAHNFEPLFDFVFHIPSKDVM